MTPVIVSTFGRISSTTIPLENFVNIKSECFRKAIVSFGEISLESATRMKSLYPDDDSIVSGVHSVIPGIKVVKLAIQLIKLKPVLVHNHHSLPSLLTAITAKLFTNAKIVQTIHNDFNYFKWYQKLFFRLSIRLSDTIVCNSQNTLSTLPNDVIKRAADNKCVLKVIYNGVDFEKIPLKDQFSPENAPFKLIMVSRLVPQKDHILAIRAIMMLLKRGKNVILDLIGTGPLLTALEKEVQELELNENVNFLGFKNRQDIYNILPSYDCFLVTSRWEGFCNAMVEALGSGLPVIASNVQPLPEVASDKAIFFEQGNEEDLSSKILQLMTDQSLQENLSSQASRYVRDKYSLISSSGQYLDTYIEMLE